MTNLIERAEGLGRVAAGFDQKHFVIKRNQLVRESESGDTATDYADGCAKEIAAGRGAIELSEVDLHAAANCTAASA
jgi:hypothetical protein